MVFSIARVKFSPTEFRSQSALNESDIGKVYHLLVVDLMRKDFACGALTFECPEISSRELAPAIMPLNDFVISLIVCLCLYRFIFTKAEEILSNEMHCYRTYFRVVATKT